MGLMNAAIVFWFLERTEAHASTIFLAGRQKALAFEFLELTRARTQGAGILDSTLQGAVREFEASMTILQKGGLDRGVAIPPAPRLVSSEVEQISRHWHALKDELEGDPELERVRQLTESLARDQDALVATLHARRQLYRSVLAVLAGMTSLMLLAVALMGARIIRTRIVEPLSGLQALARRALERKPPPDLELPQDDALGGAVEAVTDLSARLEKVRIERDVAQAEYQTVFDNSLAGIYRIEADGRMVLANAALAELLGYESPDQLLRSVVDAHRDVFVDPEHRERVAHPSAASAAARLAIVETRMRRKDGSEVWVLESSRRTRHEEGDGCEGVVIDITPRKKAFDALRRLTARLMEIQDEERQRLARELHDSMGQLLAAMKMNLTRLEDTTELSSEALELLRDSLELGEEASRQTRTMSHLLHPPLLEELGLEHAIRDYAAGYQKRSGIQVDVDITVPERLPPSLETCLFRFVQEGLTNVHRHSGSQRATIRLFRRQGELLAQVEDEGRGLPADVWGDDGELESLGVGLRGLNARLDQLDGRLEIESAASGTTVTAIVRLEPPLK